MVAETSDPDHQTWLLSSPLITVKAVVLYRFNINHHNSLMRKARFRNVGAGKGVKQALDAETLRRLYVEGGRTQVDIAREFGCTPQFVSLLVHEYGLERRFPAKKDDAP